MLVPVGNGGNISITNDAAGILNVDVTGVINMKASGTAGEGLLTLTPASSTADAVELTVETTGNLFGQLQTDAKSVTVTTPGTSSTAAAILLTLNSIDAESGNVAS